MTEEYVLDCLFDLMNDSDLLDVKDLFAKGNALHVTLFDGSSFVVAVSKDSVEKIEKTEK